MMEATRVSNYDLPFGHPRRMLGNIVAVSASSKILENEDRRITRRGEPVRMLLLVSRYVQEAVVFAPAKYKMHPPRLIGTDLQCYYPESQFPSALHISPLF